MPGGIWRRLQPYATACDEYWWCGGSRTRKDLASDVFQWYGRSYLSHFGQDSLAWRRRSTEKKRQRGAFRRYKRHRGCLYTCALDGVCVLLSKGLRCNTTVMCTCAVRLLAHTHARAHAHTCTNTHTRTHTHAHTHARTHTHIYTFYTLSLSALVS